MTLAVLDDLAAKNALVREELGRMQFIGQQQEINNMFSFVDWLDDFIARKRIELEAPAPGSASGSTPFPGSPRVSPAEPPQVSQP